MRDLQGKRIALLEGRMQSELADLVRRHGGVPCSVPALREVALEGRKEVEAFLNRLAAGEIDVLICLTGAGVSALLREASALQRLPELMEKLQGLTTVCRGPKPVAVLKRHDLPVTLQVSAPYTTSELLAALQTLPLQGRGVGLLHYGERNDALTTALQSRGARLDELCLYDWRLPEDLTALRQLVRELIAGQYDAIAFTTQIQARHLWQVAAEIGVEPALTEALRRQCVVAAVGPTCAATLETLGVTPQVIPVHPKMGPMVLALAAYFTSMSSAAAVLPGGA